MQRRMVVHAQVARQPQEGSQLAECYGARRARGPTGVRPGRGSGRTDIAGRLGRALPRQGEGLMTHTTRTLRRRDRAGGGRAAAGHGRRPSGGLRPGGGRVAQHRPLRRLERLQRRRRPRGTPPNPSRRLGASTRRRGRLRQVGHEPLKNRGMNAAIAVHEDYAYVGSRTDGGHGDPRRAASWWSTSTGPRGPAWWPARSTAGGRVDARAARLAVAGRADRAQHELRRRRPAPPLHAAVDQQHPLLRHRRP